MKFVVEITRPEVEELLEAREAGMNVVVLRDVSLQEQRMIWHPVEDLCRRQAQASKLCYEISVVVGVALLRAGKALDELKTENDDQKTGINIVRKALSWPARLIAITTLSRVPPQSQVY